MRFTVTWHGSALAELADIWMRASDRQAVNDATLAIDRALAHDPETKGEEYYGDRLLVAVPLAVTYTVRRDDRIAEVLQVWHR